MNLSPNNRIHTDKKSRAASLYSLISPVMRGVHLACLCELRLEEFPVGGEHWAEGPPRDSKSRGTSGFGYELPWTGIVEAEPRPTELHALITP